MNFSLVSLNIGKVSKLKVGSRMFESAFDKSSIGKAFLDSKGFRGDEQADLINHGGIDKAVCVYSLHHMPLFTELLGGQASIPAFGENFSVDYADENDIYIGDVFKCGEVELQVSQPRQPCFKAGAFLKNNSVIKLMTDQSATGFYFRVLSTGEVEKGAVFERVKSDQIYSLSLANDIMYRREESSDVLREFISYEFLSKSWKEELEPRIARADK